MHIIYTGHPERTQQHYAGPFLHKIPRAVSIGMIGWPSGYAAYANTSPTRNGPIPALPT